MTLLVTTAHSLPAPTLSTQYRQLLLAYGVAAQQSLHGGSSCRTSFGPCHQLSSQLPIPWPTGVADSVLHMDNDPISAAPVFSVPHLFSCTRSPLDRAPHWTLLPPTLSSLLFLIGHTGPGSRQLLVLQGWWSWFPWVMSPHPAGIPSGPVRSQADVLQSFPPTQLVWLLGR